MLLERIEDAGLAQYSYLVGSRDEIAVVDPRRDIDVYLDWAKQHGVRIKYVLETHIHADFASGARELASRAGAALLVSGHDTGETFVVSGPHEDVKDGARIVVGGVEVQVVHTPGHTPEHVSFLVFESNRAEPAAMLSGDFLFVGSVGRPDLLGDDETAGLASRLYDSVQKLRAYPDALSVYPGHGAGSMCGSGMGQAPRTTLGQERLSNPYLNSELTRDQFVKKLLASAPPFPPYYRRMKSVNAAGARILDGIPGQQALALDDFRKRVDAKHLVIDLREQTAFGSGHIHGAFGIGAGRLLSMWAAWVVPYDTPILLVGAASQIEDAARSLVRVGLDEVGGYLEGGMDAWTGAGLPVACAPQVTPRELHNQMEGGDGPEVLDVRTDNEWGEGHLPGALHIMGGYLPERVDEVPRDRPVVVVCATGYRSTIATSVLARAGFTNVSHLTGGIQAWKDAGFDTMRDA